MELAGCIKLPILVYSSSLAEILSNSALSQTSVELTQSNGALIIPLHRKWILTVEAVIWN